MNQTAFDSRFWRDKRVFLTGHTGFKGSWLSLWLAALGARVTGYALAPPTSPSLFDLARVGESITDMRGDVRDAQQLQQAVAHAAPDIVLHLAAQPLVRESYDDPLCTFDTNVMGTANLLNAVRHSASVKATVVVTTDKCYENREWAWAYRENEAMGGADPYSASKGCAELVTHSFRRSFFAGDGSAIASARAGNVIGGGDFAKDRLITDIVNAMSEGHPARIRNPNAVRPWQHVMEPLCGYLLLAQALWDKPTTLSPAYNFGPEEADAQPVRWICDALAERWGEDALWEHDGGEHPHEATYLKLDSSLARSELGWCSRLRLADSLDWIVEWHRARLENKDLREFTLAQIKAYEEML